MESHRWQQSLVRDVDLLMQHHPTAVAIVIYVVPGAKSVVDIRRRLHTPSSYT
jgi:hypothetical protein